MRYGERCYVTLKAFQCLASIAEPTFQTLIQKVVWPVGAIESSTPSLPSLHTWKVFDPVRCNPRFSNRPELEDIPRSRCLQVAIFFPVESVLLLAYQERYWASVFCINALMVASFFLARSSTSCNRSMSVTSSAT